MFGAGLGRAEREYIRARTLEGLESVRTCGKTIDDAMLSMGHHRCVQALSGSAPGVADSRSTALT